MEEAPKPTLRGRARTFVRGRPRTQKVGALGAAALLATAPFGGLRAVPPPAPEPIHADQVVHLGPLDVTVRRISTESQVAPTIRAKNPGDRFLVVVTDVTNVDTQPQDPLMVSDVLRLDHAGDLLDVLTGDPVTTGGQAQAYLFSDATEATTDPVNPGLTKQIAFVFEQRPGWTPRDVTVRLTGYVWVTHDPLTLGDDQWWTPPGPPETRAATHYSGVFPVQVKP